MNWTNLRDYTLQRLSERSTWVGLIGMVTAAGMTISPQMAEQIASTGAAIAGLVLIATKDKPSISVTPVVNVSMLPSGASVSTSG